MTPPSPGPPENPGMSFRWRDLEAQALWARVRDANRLTNEELAGAGVRIIAALQAAHELSNGGATVSAEATREEIGLLLTRNRVDRVPADVRSGDEQ